MYKFSKIYLSLNRFTHNLIFTNSFRFNKTKHSLFSFLIKKDEKIAKTVPEPSHILEFTEMKDLQENLAQKNGADYNSDF